MQPVKKRAGHDRRRIPFGDLGDDPLAVRLRHVAGTGGIHRNPWPATAAIAARYAWQAAAGLYAAFAVNDPSSDDSEACATNLDDLIDGAVANADEHAIKFAEACIGEHALNPKPVHLRAAADALKKLPPLR